MEFTTPAFLQNHSTEEIFEKMKEILPDDLDLSEGNHAWNMTYPTALVAAYICEYVLPETIKVFLPEWSYGDFLDGHAKSRGMTRRAATVANGEITITGEPKSVVPAGSLFSTASINDEPSVDYETLEDVVIPETGSITVDVHCTKPGTIGNTTENTVILVASKLTGISAVTNEHEITGGTEEESDETLILRIDTYDKSQGESYVGSRADYKRWALSVPGVGETTVITPTDDSGLITLIVTDTNGDPATEQLCEAVYNYIMRPGDEGSRLAPINASLSVVSPSTMDIGITATIELADSASIESVKTAFLSQIALYLAVAMDEGEIKYTRVAAVLSDTEGVNDFKDLKMGVKTEEGITYSTENIAISTKQLPTVTSEDVILSSGTV